jgi:AraC-like DNA-binding protein
MRACTEEPKLTETTTFRFSTLDVAPGDRLTAWREALGRIHIVPQVAPANEGTLQASIVQHSYACMTLSFIETSPTSLSLPSAQALRASSDRYLLLVDGTRFDAVADDSVEHLDCGDAILLSGSAIVTVHLHAAGRVTAIRLPANSLPSAARPLGGRAFAPLSRSTAAFRYLVRNIKLLGAEEPESDAVLVRRAANYLSELVTLALEPSAPRCSEIRRKARLSPILEDVLANLSKPGLSAKTVAKRHGITDRYVHLLFKQSGQTFSRFVQEERLKRAFALLTNPELAWMRISEIAFESGFADLSTFNRTFRGHFGNHPKGVRAAFAARAAAPKAVPFACATASHDGVRELL